MSNQSFGQKLSFFIKRSLLNLSFDSRKYWELRYQSNWNSGTGSYGENAEAKAEILNQLIEKYRITSLIEFGCGDGNNLKQYRINKYLGLDVSSKTIQNCINNYLNDSTKSFMAYNPLAFHKIGNFLQADATMSLDVIFHLVEDEIFKKYMHDLFSSSQNYVFIYSSNHDDNENSSKHVRHWKFTDFIEGDIKNFKLAEIIESETKSGEKLNNWFIYKKINAD